MGGQQRRAGRDVGYDKAVGRIERVFAGLALVAGGLLILFVLPAIGVGVTGAGLALMRWGATDRRAQLPLPLPGSPRSRTPDEVADTPRPDGTEPFDPRRPRDLLTLAFIGLGFACVLGVWVAGPVLHPVHVTVPVALALVFLTLRRMLSRED